MSSMRLLERMTASGSHCLVEWIEPGAPCSIVPIKQVKQKEGEDVTVGEVCKVGFRQGVKMSYYDAKILGIGSKQLMELKLDELEAGLMEKSEVNEEEGSDIQETEDEDGIPSPGPRRGKKKSKRASSDDSESDEHSVSPSPPPSKKGKKTPAAITKNPTGPSKSKRGRPVGTKRAKELARCAENIRMTQMLLADLPGTPDKSSDTRAEDDEVLPMEDSTGTAATHSSSGTATTLPPSGTATTHIGGEKPPSVLDNSSLLSPSPLKHSSYSLSRNHTTFLDITNHQEVSTRYSSTPKLLKYDELKAWMEGQFSAITSMITKNTEAIDTLKGLLLRKKNKMTDGIAGDSDVSEGVMDCGENKVKRVEHGDRHVNQPLQVVWGDPAARHVTLLMPSEQSVADFHQLSACGPSEPGKYALRLLSLFFSNEELAVSNCTPAEGRKLLAKEKLMGIKYQINYKFPLPTEEEEKRWVDITKKMNSKCRGCRKQKKTKEEKEEQENTATTI